MLTLYRRHLKTCPQTDRFYKKCQCPMWIEGVHDGKYRRESMKINSWTSAEIKKKNILNHDPNEKPKITIEAALNSFVADCETRKLNPSTLSKYSLLRDNLSVFAERHHLTGIAELQSENVRRFRDGRTLGARTAAKELERIRAFFKFCISNDWITKNPATSIKPPQVKTLPRIPFSEQEVENILAHAKDDRELTFLQVLRHTGLRIGDASLLRVSQFAENRIYLYTTKAGTPVSVVIPPQLITLLQAIKTTGGYFFLWGESTHVHSVSNLWRRRIKAICKELKIMPDHPHRFRHSLAADLLIKGASVEDVAAILGNSPAVVVRHYSQWIKGRQDKLDAVVAKTWERPQLKLVKGGG